MGQVPMAAARDGLFPAFFARLSARDVPALGIVVSAVLATILVLIQAFGSGGFARIYTLIVGLSTMTAVVPYAFCALAASLLPARDSHGVSVPRLPVVEAVAFVFAIFTLYGCGAEAVLYGFVLMLLGLPVYVWQRRSAGTSWASSPAETPSSMAREVPSLETGMNPQSRPE